MRYNSGASTSLPVILLLGHVPMIYQLMQPVTLAHVYVDKTPNSWEYHPYLYILFSRREGGLKFSFYGYCDQILRLRLFTANLKTRRSVSSIRDKGTVARFLLQPKITIGNLATAPVSFKAE